MTILVVGKQTDKGNLNKVKFDTQRKIYNQGKYNVHGGAVTIQAANNKEVKDVIETLVALGFQYDSRLE